LPLQRFSRVEFKCDRNAAIWEVRLDENDEPQPNPNDASIFTVLQERLGLKLESSRAPLEVYVIDHVERPDPN
jgi:uncharacterized protein (TIGR03435 family)